MKSNPALELNAYIDAHLGDQGDTWAYFHTPHLESVLQSLNEKHAQEFSAKLWEWEAYHWYRLADPILFCRNLSLDADFLYCKIFSKLDDPGSLVYLAQNIHPCLHPECLQEWDSKLLESIRDNLYFILNYIREESWIEYHLESIEMIQKELENR